MEGCEVAKSDIDEGKQDGAEDTGAKCCVDILGVFFFLAYFEKRQNGRGKKKTAKRSMVL